MAIETPGMAGPCGLAMLFLLTACPSPCVEAVYNFQVNASFTPVRDSMRVGDTLFLVSEFPTRLKDIPSGKAIDYAGASSIGNTFGIVELIPNAGNTPTGSVHAFDYVALEGDIFNSKAIPSPETTQQVTYRQYQGEYRLRIGIIARKKGIFLIGIGSSAFSNTRKGKTCAKANFETIIVNQEQHLHYLEDFLKHPASPVSKQTSYCFKVLD